MMASPIDRRAGILARRVVSRAKCMSKKLELTFPEITVIDFKPRSYWMTVGNMIAGQVAPVVPAPPAAAPQDSVRKRTSPVEPQVDGMWLGFSDVDRGRCLVYRYGRRIRFVDGVGWYRWTGSRWNRASDAEMGELARSAVNTIVRPIADRAGVHRQKALSEAKRAANVSKIGAMLKAATYCKEVRVERTQLDADPDLLCTPTATVNLRTGAARKPDRSDLCTMSTRVGYAPQEDCPRFRSFIKEVTASDGALATYLQRMLGYCLTGDTREQVFFLFTGTGSNGKSVLVEIVRSILGDYMAPATAKLLTGAEDVIPNEVAGLRGRRLVSVSETASGAVLNERRVKAISGEDQVKARLLFKEFVDFRPTFKLLLVTNALPRLSSVDHSMRRRPRVVPFRVQFDPPDMELKAKLLAEAPGILNWLIEGAQLWHQGGLGSCTAVEQATAAYLEGADSVQRWVKDRCDVAPDALSETGRVLHQDYAAWCKDGGDPPISEKAFHGRLDGLGFTKAPSHGKGRRRLGLRLSKH